MLQKQAGALQHTADNVSLALRDNAGNAMLYAICCSFRAASLGPEVLQYYGAHGVGGAIRGTSQQP